MGPAVLLLLAAGGVLVIFGFFLIILGGLEIAASVSLFRSTAAMFVIIVSVLVGAADLLQHVTWL